MIAMIFAAGLGTRLKPLTNDIPKALVQINGKTLLQYNIEKLKKAGIENIVINVHHFADKVKNFLIQKNNFGMNILISDESSKLLDTGGGIVKAKPFFKNFENILLYNVDVISDIDINKMLDFHKTNKTLATLAVRNRETNRKFLFNEKKLLCGWKNIQTNEIIQTRSSSETKELAFSGIHIISNRIFEYLPTQGKFSITKAYLELSNKHEITHYQDDNNFWIDAGKHEALKILEEKSDLF